MEPLRLTIELADYMAAPEMPFHLDSLCHALMAQRLGLMDGVAEHQAAITQALRRVLDCHEDDPRQVYKASVFHAEGPVLLHKTGIIRRNDFGDVAEQQLKGLLDRRGKKISASIGRERHAMFMRPLIWPHRVVADCVADREAMENLLRGGGRCAGLTHLGALRRIGAGEVKRWSLEPIEDRAAGTQRFYSAPFEGAVALVGRCTPPYFWRHDKEPVFAPPQTLTAL